MQFFITLYYACRSVLSRGPLKSYKMWVNEKAGDKKFCIHTGSFKKSDSREFFHYQGASYTVLEKIFINLDDHHKTLQFIDIGCGRGRALFFAENRGFSHILGIEYDKELFEAAKNNLASYCLKRPDSKIELAFANALEHNYEDKPTLYFLFNPFGEDVLSAVLDRILGGTRSETWFVYMNPLYASVFEKKGLKLVKTLRTYFYTESKIFLLRRLNS